MVIRSRNGNELMDPVFGTIATVATKNKFIDFRDALTLAYVEDYGMLKGIGGKKHAYTSGIRILIQDNTGKSTSANAIVPEYVFDIIGEVCRQNLHSPKPDRSVVKATRRSGMEVIPGLLSAVSNGFAAILNGGVQACANIVRGKGNQAGYVADIGGVLRNAESAFKNGAQNSISLQNPYTDWQYSQTRVNIHKRGGDGFCPVSTCEIKRTQYRTDGQLSGMPWQVTITSFEAKAKEHDNGTFSPDMSTVRNSTSLFINITDEQMWYAVYSVQHFVRVWEDAYAVPLVRAGIKAKEEQFANANKE